MQGGGQLFRPALGTKLFIDNRRVMCGGGQLFQPTQGTKKCIDNRRVMQGGGQIFLVRGWALLHKNLSGLA